MPKFQANRGEYQLGRSIGVGGFARVYEATAPDGSVVAAKFVPKTPGAEREMLVSVELDGVVGVVPVLDTGENTGFWILVMPRASGSLRQAIEAGPLSFPEALDVLKQVASAFDALQGRVVHRDLKPENVLRLGGTWAVSDFGIARYTDASTSADTRKFSLTPPYAAPEQWKLERATPATDVYAFGVTAFELANGHRPFPGPDFREQHLSAAPPASGGPAALQAIITEALFKPAASRPTFANIAARLNGLDVERSPGAALLQLAGAQESQRRADAQAAVAAAETESDRRKRLLDVARISIEPVLGAIRESVVSAAPQAGKDFPFELSGVTLDIDHVESVAISRSGSDRYDLPFDVIATAAIGVRQPEDQWQYSGRNHSLWYCDARVEGEYRWFETAFIFSIFSGKRGRSDPFAMKPGDGATAALSPVMGTEYQVAWPFTPVDHGEHAEFVERWIKWFGTAATAKLHRPSNMPDRDPSNSWRGR